MLSVSRRTIFKIGWLKMANYCSNNITAKVTDSEWREISMAFENNLIDWPASMDGTFCSDWSKEISCTTKWSPTPWDEGKMTMLSESYSCALFHYVTDIEGGYRSPSAWFCNGEEGNKKEAESSRKQAYKDEVERFLSATKHASEGVYHRVEVMPDGRVAADGENRFGECNIFSWTNIKTVSCGNWHTVALREDGTLIACGSNANNQCNVLNLEEKAKSVSCGRYHTAILLESGKVVVRGNLEQEAKTSDTQEEYLLSPEDFPLIENLHLDKYVSGWEQMNERIESISVGDELSLKKITKSGDVCFEVLNMSGEKIGELYTYRSRSLAKLLKNVKVTVETVTPLSQRRKGSKYAAMTIKIEHVQSEVKTKTVSKKSLKIGEYKQTDIEQWPPVEKILSVFDAVIGVTTSGEYFVDGFCPCTEDDIVKIASQINTST